jgi:uncharacterized protein
VFLDDQTATLQRILADSKTIAVVGLSANPARPSHSVAKYLQKHGYRIIPVNPNYREVLGETCYPALADVPVKIDIVDCFRRSAEMVPVAREAAAVGATCLWMQLGVVNAEAAAIARQTGMVVVSDRCIKIDHAHWFG